MNGKQGSDIRDLTPGELRSFFSERKEKSFRAAQVVDWIWKKNCNSFGEMTDLPKGIRSLLEENFTFYKALPAQIQESNDRTLKIAFTLHDRLTIEGVLIPLGNRHTACVSSQCGCPLGCVFCGTGRLGFQRNLTAGEIFDQVSYLNHMAFSRTGNIRGLSNIVYMGMGEPLLNYRNVKKSVLMLSSEEGLGMSPRKVTLSSVGLPKMIREMADDNPPYYFALSLHSANDETRNKLVPFNLQHPLQEISDSLQYYHQRTGKRFTIEYILFRDVNDSMSDARELAGFCRKFPVKINLIEYNPVKGTELLNSTDTNIQAFANILQKKNLVVNIRKSRGRDIDAACGQLAGKTGSEKPNGEMTGSDVAK